jgi:Ca2+-binding EF-hand superfamily protein
LSAQGPIKPNPSEEFAMSRKLFAAALVCLFCTATARADDAKADKKAAKFDKAKLFEKMDADKDGKVTKDEYKKFFDGVVEKLKDAGKGEKIAGKLDGVAEKSFEKIDADKDGKITKEEFEKAEGFGGDLGGKIDTEKLKKLLMRKKDK